MVCPKCKIGRIIENPILNIWGQLTDEYYNWLISCLNCNWKVKEHRD